LRRTGARCDTEAVDPTKAHTVHVVKQGTVIGPDGLRRAIRDSPVRIGRDRGCELVVDDPAVSAVHCDVFPDTEGVALRDLGSKNGTFVHGTRIRHAWLTNACSITIGGSSIRFEPEGREATELQAVDRFGPLHGSSTAMRRVYRLIKEVASTEVAVRITGESGTGKDVVARTIHDASRRARGPFVVVDCGSIPASLIEGHLFGHERGAYTHAVDRTDGALRAAHGGTLFLDEIGELPLDLQPKLLRALSDRQVQRVGGKKYDEIDIRLLSATHRDVERMTNAGEFRLDLFFRLGAIKLELPPLRERREDIPLIVKAYCDKIGAAERAGAVVALLGREIAQRHWSGNVRELVAITDAVAQLSPDAEALIDVLGRQAGHAAAPIGAFAQAKTAVMDAFEHEYFERLAHDCQGNITEMMRRSGVQRHRIREHLRRLGLYTHG